MSMFNVNIYIKNKTSIAQRVIFRLIFGHSISLVATLLNQQSAQLNKVKEDYIGSICGQQLFRSLRAHQRSLDQMKILKDQSAQTTSTAVGIAYHLWLPFSINRMLNLTKLRSII